MRSPFSFFRRHQKVLLAGLGVLAMFGFVILPVIVEGLQVSRGRNIVVATSRYGTIRESTLAELMRQRGVMLRFLNLVGEMLIQAGENPLQVQEVLAQVGPATEDAVVNRWLLSRFGQQMGLSVDQRMINEFIADLTQGKIPGANLEQMLERQGISVAYLFQVLGEELLALRVRDLFLTNFLGFTPGQHWDYFQRFNRRVMVETVALPVERFIDQVSEQPSPTELRQFFERYRYQVADPDSPEPGFMEPKRVVIEYLKAPFDQFVEKARAEVTDAEILAYYEQNKDRIYRREPLPTLPAGQKTDETPSGPPEQQPSEGPAITPPAESKPAETQEPQATDSQPGAQPEAPSGEASPEPEGADNAQAGQAMVPEDSPSEGPATGSAPAGPDSSDNTDSGSPKADGAASSPAPSASAPSAEQLEDEPGDGDGSDPEASPAAAEQQSVDEYIPLEKVREEIRSTLARQKAGQLMEALLNKLQAQLSRYREDKILYDLEVKQRGGTRRPEPAMPNLRAMAQEHSLEYDKRGPLTNFELSQLEIAQATTPLGGSVLEMVFHRLPVFRPTTARDFQGNQYLVWKIEESPSRIPDWNDPGVRENVLRAWQLTKARAIARAEAEKLAAQARQAQKPLAEVFAGREDLRVVQSDPFTWLTSPLPLIFARFERPRISQVKGVDRPGEEFMRTVYQLRPGEVGVAMNHPQTEVYVVRLVETQPPEDILWQQFTTDPGRLYLIAGSDEMVRGYAKLVEHIRQQANFQWTPEWQRRRAERPPEWD